MKTKILKKSKIIFATVGVFFLELNSASAQLTGNNSDVTQRLKDIGRNVKGPLDIAVGLLGLAGAFLVFFQYKSGKPEAKDNLVKLVIGLSIWYITPAILKVFGFDVFG